MPGWGRPLRPAVGGRMLLLVLVVLMHAVRLRAGVRRFWVVRCCPHSYLVSVALPRNGPLPCAISSRFQEPAKVSSSAVPAGMLTVTVAPSTENGVSVGAGRVPPDWTVWPPSVMPLVADRPLAVRATFSPEV